MAYDQTFAFGFQPLQAVGFQGQIFSFKFSQDALCQMKSLARETSRYQKNSIQWPTPKLLGIYLCIVNFFISILPTEMKIQTFITFCAGWVRSKTCMHLPTQRPATQEFQGMGLFDLRCFKRLGVTPGGRKNQQLMMNNNNQWGISKKIIYIGSIHPRDAIMAYTYRVL